MSWVTSIIQALLGSSLAGKVWDLVTGKKREHSTNEDSYNEVEKIDKENQDIKDRNRDLLNRR